MTKFAVYKNKSAEDGAREFLRTLLSENLIDGLFAPAVTPWSLLPMPHLFTSADNTDRLTPLAPVAPFNAATQAAQVLAEASGKRVAVVLKPCEIRAFIELAKLNQCVIDDNVIIIGIECRGRLENKTYLESIKEDSSFTASFYKDEKLRDDITESCRGCTDFIPEKADIAILTMDWKDDTIWFAADSEKGKSVIEKANLESANPSEARNQEINDLKKKREETKKEQLKAVNEEVSSMEGFQKIIAECLNCQNCRNACPVCYCRECVFKTDVFDNKPDILLKRADKRSGIKLPQDTTMFHMTRMLHIAHACVGCGQCTSACPQSIPVADFFRASAEKMQNLYGYKPGRNIEEKIPMLSFGETDGK
ncbi:MAG: Coenzyme F420 hydrogenase/dehydrogenase, beta subunit C-terminal domain [Deltaproteobacteria bacterium]|nr:Coenzyme F420 hydrogenase/dehydrogenase, beta subunit C-terminal domain [Deltaproteobacteria bacterium]